MKKLNQIIFISLLFVLSFGQAFGEEYWQCEKIEGSGSLFFNDESSCDISSNPPYKQCKTGTCKKIDTEGSWVCTGLNAQTDIYFIGDEAGCKNFQEANPLKCNCAKEGAGVNIVPVDLLPNSTREDRPNGYKLLAPIGDFDFVSYDSKSDNFVGNYLSIIFKLAIGIISALAVIMLIVAGIQYMGEDSIFGKTKAKNQMTNAILGLLIALGSYAILYTISPDLIGDKGLSVKKVSMTLDEAVYGPKATTGTGHRPDTDEDGNKYYCGNPEYIEGKEWGKKEEEDALEEKLKEAGIEINKGRCEKIGQKNCTSLYQLEITKVIDFAKKCNNCDVVITGGTECWLHSKETPHRPGGQIVDLRITNSVTNFIEKEAEEGSSNLGPVFTKKDGSKFLEEKDHYHVIKWSN